MLPRCAYGDARVTSLADPEQPGRLRPCPGHGADVGDILVAAGVWVAFVGLLGVGMHKGGRLWQDTNGPLFRRLDGLALICGAGGLLVLITAAPLKAVGLLDLLGPPLLMMVAGALVAAAVVAMLASAVVLERDLYRQCVLANQPWVLPAPLVATAGLVLTIGLPLAIVLPGGVWVEQQCAMSRQTCSNLLAGLLGSALTAGTLMLVGTVVFAAVQVRRRRRLLRVLARQHETVDAPRQTVVGPAGYLTAT